MQYKLFRVGAYKRRHYSVYDFAQKCQKYIEYGILKDETYKTFLKNMFRMTSKQMSQYMLDIVEINDALLKQFEDKEDEYERIPFCEIYGNMQTYYENN